MQELAGEIPKYTKISTVASRETPQNTELKTM